MNPIYGVDYTHDAYLPHQEHFGPINVVCPICKAGLGQMCKDRDKGHSIEQTHRARRSRAKKLIRVLEKEQLGCFTVSFGKEIFSAGRPRDLYFRFGSPISQIWHNAFGLKELEALRSMHRAQMEAFKRKLRGEEARTDTPSPTGRNTNLQDVLEQQIIFGAQARKNIIDELSNQMEFVKRSREP